MKAFPLGKFDMPSTSLEGDVVYEDKKISLSFITEKDRKIIRFKAPSFQKNTPIEGELILSEIPEESMVIATPFKEKKTAFYFNQKINCMKANGTVRMGTQTLEFKNANATLDWGRGVWTYDNTWYWGTCSSSIDGIPFGFNIGYGFGDLSNATENMIFYNGKAHKIDQVTFEIEKTGKGKYEYLKPWKFTSNDKRFECTFTPILDRFDKIDLLLLVSDQHQVFGKVNGFVVLDDGTKLEIKNHLASAEVVHNRW
jgi:stress response protein SCP2